MPVDLEARVQITVPGHVTDVPMSNHMLIGDCMAELIPFITAELKQRGKDTAWLEDDTAHWVLRRPFRSGHLDEEKTLQQEGVLDGSRLLLVKKTPGEKYPPLIDDVAEAISYWLKLFYRSWDSQIAQRVSLIVLPAVVAVLCLLANYWAAATAPTITARAAVCAALAIPAAAAGALGVVIARTRKERYQPLVVPLLVITYLLVGSAALAITPRPLGIAQLVVAGATLFTLAIALVTLTRSAPRLNYGIGTAALAVTAVAALNMAYHSTTAVMCCQLIALSFAVVLMANTAARALARISLPYVPTRGEDYDPGVGRAGDLDAGSLPIDGQSNESVFNQEQQIRTAYDCTVGILIGALTPAVVAAWFMGHSLDNHQWLLTAFALVIAVNLVFRGRSYDDALTQGVLLIAATLFLMAFAAGLIISPFTVDNLALAVLVAATLLTAAVVATVYAVQERRIISPVVNRALQVVESLTYVSVFPIVAFAMDAFSKARNR